VEGQSAQIALEPRARRQGRPVQCEDGVAVDGFGAKTPSRLPHSEQVAEDRRDQRDPGPQALRAGGPRWRTVEDDGGDEGGEVGARLVATVFHVLDQIPREIIRDGRGQCSGNIEDAVELQASQSAGKDVRSAVANEEDSAAVRYSKLLPDIVRR